MTSKVGAGVILKTLLNIDINLETLPLGDETGATNSTVVAVNEVVKEARHVMRF